MNSGNSTLIIIVIVAFAGGYAIVSFIVDWIRKQREMDVPHQRNSNYSSHSTSGNDWRSQSDDDKYARVLQLLPAANPDDIKRAYLDLIAKYHPDKVNHLGDDLKHLAEMKTRDLNEAYAYFQKNYNMP